MADVPELVALLYRADWTQLSLSATVSKRRDKAVHRRLRNLARAEQDRELGPIPRFWLPRDDHMYDGPDWPETELHILVAPGGRYRVSRDDRGPATVSMIGEASVGGRPGYRIWAQAPGLPWPWAASQRFTLDVIVDAEHGILLRRTQYFGDRPAARSELRNLTSPNRPGDFHIDAGPGLREVFDSGGLFADTDLPGPVKVAGTAAALAATGVMAGATALTGWLQKRRARPDSSWTYRSGRSGQGPGQAGEGTVPPE